MSIKKSENQESESFLKYKSVDIYFTYSFLLDYNDKKFAEFVAELEDSPEWLNGSPEDREGITPFLHIQKKLSGDEKKLSRYRGSEYISLSFHKKSEKKSQKLNFYLYGAEEPYAEFSVDIETTTRIFFNGSGCVTFKVSSGQNKMEERKFFGLKEIKQILSLNRRMFLKEGHSKLNNDELYDLFMKELNPFKKNGTLLCKNVVNLGDKEDENIFPQNPNVFSIVELEKNQEFWTHGKRAQDIKGHNEEIETRNENIVNKNKEIANILLQIIDDKEFFDDMRGSIENIRIPYRLRNNIGLVKNHSWDYRIMICINRNASLLVTHDKEKKPVSFIERSFLDINEILRTRWHMNIVLNALLDHDIESIKGEPSKENIELLKTIIDRRKQYAYFLHDPLPYRYLGGSITDIIDIAEDEMWSDKLRDMTFRKFDVLDKLYEDQMEYIRIISFSDLEEKIEVAKEIENRVKDTISELKGEIKRL